MSHGETLLEARDLRVARGGTEVLRIPSLTVTAGETVAIVGPNGAGKTSLLLALASLIRPFAGEVLFRGEAVGFAGSGTGYRRRLAMVFQEPLLFDATVFDNVAAGLRIRGVSRRETAELVGAALKRFRIGHLAARSARKLSGGEAQRTSLARAFATGPELLLLDEPFVALDPPTRQALTEDLEKILRESGIATVMATHDQAEALRLADRMAVMHAGSIVQCGTPLEVMSRPANEFVATFVGMENVFTGTVGAGGSGLLTLTVGGATVEVVGEGVPGEEAVICVRPENVLVTTADPDRTTSARNVFGGRVVKIVRLGLFNKVYLDCGIILTAAITNQSLDELALHPGSPVYASFKATSVHLVRTGDAGAPEE